MGLSYLNALYGHKWWTAIMNKHFYCSTWKRGYSNSRNCCKMCLWIRTHLLFCRYIVNNIINIFIQCCRSIVQFLLWFTFFLPNPWSHLVMLKVLKVIHGFIFRYLKLSLCWQWSLSVFYTGLPDACYEWNCSPIPDSSLGARLRSAQCTGMYSWEDSPLDKLILVQRTLTYLTNQTMAR